MEIICQASFVPRRRLSPSSVGSCEQGGARGFQPSDLSQVFRSPDLPRVGPSVSVAGPPAELPHDAGDFGCSLIWE